MQYPVVHPGPRLCVCVSATACPLNGAEYSQPASQRASLPLPPSQRIGGLLDHMHALLGKTSQPHWNKTLEDNTGAAGRSQGRIKSIRSQDTIVLSDTSQESAWKICSLCTPSPWQQAELSDCLRYCITESLLKGLCGNILE